MDLQREPPDGTCADTGNDVDGLAHGCVRHALGHDADRAATSAAYTQHSPTTPIPRPYRRSRPALLARLTGTRGFFK